MTWPLRDHHDVLTSSQGMQILNLEEPESHPIRDIVEIPLTKEQALKAMAHHSDPEKEIRYALSYASREPLERHATLDVVEMYNRELHEFAEQYSGLTGQKLVPKALGLILLDPVLELQQISVNYRWESNGRSKRIYPDEVSVGGLNMNQSSNHHRKDHSQGQKRRPRRIDC